MIAPASLKQAAVVSARRVVEPTPGHDCPGLIEAGVPTGVESPYAHPLRGMIAPASLKHRRAEY